MSYWLIAPGPFRGVGHIRMVSPRWPPGSTWSVFMAGRGHVLDWARRPQGRNPVA